MKAGIYESLGEDPVSLTQVIINERTWTSPLKYGLAVLSSDLAGVISRPPQSAAAQKSPPREADHSGLQGVLPSAISAPHCDSTSRELRGSTAAS